MREVADILEALEALREENKILRDVALSLTVTLLQKAAVATVQTPNVSMADVHNLMSLAEQCFDCAALPGLKEAIADGLDSAGHELMARAVEIQTKLQREKRDKE